MKYNPVLYPAGSSVLKNPFLIGIILVIAIIVGFAIAHGGFTVASIFLGLPVLIFAFNRLIHKPEYGLTFAFIINFILLGLTRYFPLTLAPLMDLTLVVIYIAVFFHYYNDRGSLRIKNYDLIILSVIWCFYLVFELVNPEVISRIAWFSFVRGLGFYMLLIVPLVLLIYNEPRHLDKFLAIWGVLSVLAALKAFMQLTLGPDPWELTWLQSGGATTHVLYGNLRAFSFYTDAGQFGAAQGHIAVIASILLMNEKKLFKKIFWTIVVIASFYGMFASGTRGAISVPLAGFALYLILRKQVKAIIIGTLFLAAVYVFFRYTFIGNTNYQIFRMRSAFTPESDASYQVRLSNQILFQDYLKTRPFGGGIGHTGAKAIRFTGTTFLSSTATDSWFVMIWADCGIVGLFLHMFIIFFIIGKSIYIVMFEIKNKDLFAREAALLCGLVGVVFASYGNSVLGQFPTGLMIYASMAFLFMGPELNKKFMDLENENTYKSLKT